MRLHRRHTASENEEEWLRALKRRDAWAWEQLQRQSLDRVFGYIAVRVPRREDAEDLTAEVFAAAVAGIEQFHGDASVATWLIGIAHRKLADAARRRQRRPEVLETDLTAVTGLAFEDRPASESPHDSLERREMAARIRRLIFQLPAAQREALCLRCVDQLSLADISRVLGRSENGVKGLLHRARKTLLERLAREDALPQPERSGQEPHDAGPFLSSTLPSTPRPG